MQAIRVQQRLESETLHLPQLRAWLGKDVEIIILEAESLPVRRVAEFPLSGSILRDDDPFAPALSTEALEAAR
jgi:hypothetical protein